MTVMAGRRRLFVSFGGSSRGMLMVDVNSYGLQPGYERYTGTCGTA